MQSGHERTFVSLDPEMIDEVLEAMKELAREGMTMIAVTHEMGFAREVADRVVIVDDGRIIEDTPPDRFFTAPTSDRSKAFLSRIIATTSLVVCPRPDPKRICRPQ
jgi:ABC-type polar amino acid transport system ATPase subunit